MPVTFRSGTIALGFGAIVLGLLMTYTLVYDGVTSPRVDDARNRDLVEVVVFFPAVSEWHEFVEGVDLCERLGITRIVERTPESLILASPEQGRRLRLVWNSTSGLRGSRDQVRELCRRASPPIGLIGSATSMLTIALAEQLREESRGGSDSLPILLIPWATTVMVERDDPADGPIALLDLYPGRSFRYCPNNRRQADFITDCVVDSEVDKKPPGRVYLVVDRKDLYSTDLAEAFRRSVARVSPEAEIIEEPEVVTGQGPPDTPTPSEIALAERIWSDLLKSANPTPTWVVLPLQGEPCRRMLAALRLRARPSTSGPDSIRVLCGDGIGLNELSLHVTNAEFPVWCVSSSVSPRKSKSDGVTAKVPAEIVASLMKALDSKVPIPLSASILGQILKKMEIGDRDNDSFGRPIAFVASGERTASASGYILAARPGSTQVVAIDRDGEGHWLKPLPLPSTPTIRP